MLPALAAKFAKAEAQNAKLKSNKKYAKKIADKLAITASGPSFSELYPAGSVAREEWEAKQEAKKWASVSW